MNVLILTPDRVGSTLLQRLITIYMLRRGFDKPVINLHELTNGLVKYYNTDLNQEVLGKPQGTDWGYFQSLPEIQDMLASVDHYKTSRLAHYHLVNRQDSIADQIKFYEYLNQNFFVISCRRDNVLEHALSWMIQAHSKKPNVYSPYEKINAFADIYTHGIEVNQIGLYNYLNKYKDYIKWVDTYFNVQDYFVYEQGMDNLEEYILGLSFMRDSENNTWEDMFGQSWDSYNAVHRTIPNLFLDKSQDADTPWSFTLDVLPREKYNELRGDGWPVAVGNYVEITDLPVPVQEELYRNFFNDSNFGKLQQINVTPAIAKFLQHNLPAYKNASVQINNIVDKGFMITGVPIKLQSLKEKKALVRNFDDCVLWYNQWVADNGIGKPYTNDELLQLSVDEDKKLNSPIALRLTDNSK